jgi:hypothetical protein
MMNKGFVVLQVVEKPLSVQYLVKELKIQTVLISKVLAERHIFVQIVIVHLRNHQRKIGPWSL